MPEVSKDNDWMLKAVGVFLSAGAVVALVSGRTLLWPGTDLDRIWSLNPRAHRELASIGKWIGLAFAALGVALAAAATGWLRRKRWGYRLATLIVAMQLLGDLWNFALGRVLQGAVGAPIAGALLVYLMRSKVRRAFS